jgi:hypothetical protein
MFAWLVAIVLRGPRRKVAVGGPVWVLASLAALEQVRVLATVTTRRSAVPANRRFEDWSRS